MSNTQLWDALGKTDPAHTKQFQRAGGFKGTALKPQWVLRKLTEQFGACGVNWGVNKPDFQVVHGQDEVLVYCTVSAWYGRSDNLLWGVGGDKVVSKLNSGKIIHDDEAFKKAFTDAIMNAFKCVGVGADIHMGQFDDNKYVQEVAEEFERAANPRISEAQIAELQQIAKEVGANEKAFLKWCNVPSWAEIPAQNYMDARNALEAKRPKTNPELGDDCVPHTEA